MSQLPVYFISHGGGPWPWMHEETHGAYDQLAAALGDIPRQIGHTPKAVLMISAHWEGDVFLVQGAAQPTMIYDYGGFPEHTYHIHYDAPGSPDVAARASQLIGAAGLPARIDPARGFDHGTFSAMAAVYPKADVPIVQVSLRRGLDPAEHVALGRALAPLRDEDVLIVGSGGSYHNLRAFGPPGYAPSKAFDAWLQQSVLHRRGSERIGHLLDWSRAPAARLAHPREEHLLPLMVATGAAPDEAATLCYHEDAFIGGLAVSSFRFGHADGAG